MRMKWGGWLYRCLLPALLLLISLLPVASATAAGANPAEHVVWVVVRGEIDQGQSALVKRAIEQAEQKQAKAIVIEMDTFGGLVDAAVSIRDLLIAQERPTVCFVRNRAWSAGALIAMANQHILMAPGSSIGAAEPIPATEKTIAAVKAEFAATAAKTGRNQRVAEAMVDKTLGFEPFAKPGQILALTGEQALSVGYATAIVADREQLLEKLGWQAVAVEEFNLTLAERGVAILSDPAVKSVLLSLIVLALMAEVKMAGSGVGIGIAVLGAALLFGSEWISGTGGWLQVLLFLAGVILLGIEALVPGFGFFGISGILCLTASFFFVLGGDTQAVLWMAFSVALAISLFLVLMRYLPKSSLWDRFVLRDVEGRREGFSSANDHRELIGKTGVVVSKLRPAGVVELDKQKYDVVSEGEFVEPGTLVQVVGVEGVRIVVRAVRTEDWLKQEEE